MNINPNIFRGYDLRGIAGKDLTPEIVEHLGRAFGTYLKRKGHKVALISRDSRATSESYGEALARGISQTGLAVTDIGLSLVGMFYWAGHYLKIPGGAFVTASHNPAEYNGFKFAHDYSETLVEEGMIELRRMITEEDYDLTDVPGEIKKENIKAAYLADLKNRFSFKKKFKVVVDAGFATAGVFIPDFLREFGCEVVEANCELDSTFPLGAPDPTETAVAKRLADRVIAEKADLGFSFDADGDRIGIVDNNGLIIWNDVLVAIFAANTLTKHPGSTIMFNTLCSKAVAETILKHGGKAFMWRTGHSFLKKKNQEVKAAFIGELSGHFFFSRDFYNHDDGAYSALSLLDFLDKSGLLLSEAVTEIPQYISSPEIKIGCADNLKVELMKKIAQKLRIDFPESEVIDDDRAGDGVRLEAPDSMMVIRYSQNGPYLTIKFESKKEERYQEIKKYLKKLLSDYKEVDWSFGVNLETLD
jgi:phosphomannomutase/phosphoglucomutase